MSAAAFWEAETLSDIGGRDEQQDRVEILSRGDALLCVLADGMGGHQGGALAAQTVIDVARERFHSGAVAEPKVFLTSIAECAHERINAVGAERGINPHSTCVLLHLTDAEATWAHVGDSRLYRFKDGKIVDRTVDHSVVELMRLQGRITEEEMKTHPDQNRLYQALGGARRPDVETGLALVNDGDGFLLASDGLWENVGGRELTAVLRTRALGSALRGLVDQAKARGGRACDNVSVAVARRQRARRTWSRRLSDSLGLMRAGRNRLNFGPVRPH